ncbi:type II restriction endonuclease [Neisseria dentiae]|uniref:type II restriction endonuclease n=3 Tax=Neisseria dentiae TaxID=194197 RepID=UPI0035A0F603
MDELSGFKLFLGQLAQTNATLDYFTDFEKIRSHIQPIEIKLNTLNYLLGKENLDTAVRQLYHENPKVFEVLGILIAIRESKKTKVLNHDLQAVSLSSFFNSPEHIIEYIELTGLAAVFRNSEITNLVDYVFGIEVGLDSNARKNRGGNNMANAVAAIFQQHNIAYRSEVYSTEFLEIASLGADIKRFDFVITTSIKTYLIETNFYNTGGSKLNEVARAYSDIAPKINRYSNYEFIWITDGQGWFSAKNKLEEAFNIIPSVYNLSTINSFIQQIKAEL